MIAIEGIPRSMYRGPMLANYGGMQGFMAPAINGGLQHSGGIYFGEQKPPGIFPPNSYPSATPANEAEKTQQQQQQQQQTKQQQQWMDVLKQRKEYSTFKKVILVLQDNRHKNADPTAVKKLRELNRSQNESCPLLKTILNVLLVSTAVVLLIAVVIVIIYTTVKPSALATPSPSHTPDEEISTARVNDVGFRPRTHVPTRTKCRSIPIVTSGTIRISKLCYQETISNDTLK